MKDIKGYEGEYAITSCGKVWSYKSKRFLKPKISKNGYMEICLSKGNQKKSYLVHRLVAKAYIPNPDNLPQISHLDETSTHNWVGNLKWATALENCNMPLHRERKSQAVKNYYKNKED